MSEQQREPETKPAIIPPPGEDLTLERHSHETDESFMQRFKDVHSTPPESKSPIDLVPNWPNIRMGGLEAPPRTPPPPAAPPPGGRAEVLPEAQVSQPTRSEQPRFGRGGRKP